jgi:D-3-phosphoglycerate dehydrogenase
VSYRVAIIDDRFGAYEQEESILGPIATLEVTRSTDPGDIAAGVRDADAVIVNLEPIPRPTIEGMRRCKIICRYGVGYDNVDIAAATECGIWVARVPDYGIEDVSDHALGLFLACVRKIPYTDRGIRDGGWGFRRNRPSTASAARPSACWATGRSRAPSTASCPGWVWRGCWPTIRTSTRPRCGPPGRSRRVWTSCWRHPTTCPFTLR